jgi:hypothetical protein
MKKSFMCSLICHNGIVGGALYLDENSLTYKTNKLTVDRAYRNLVLPLNQIAELTWKWIVFPVATFHMTSGEKYKVMIFNKRRFQKYYAEVRQD